MTAEEFDNRVWQALDPIDEKIFQVVAAPAASAAEIAAIEERIGFALPADFVTFSNKHNGLAVVARDEAWPEGEEFSVGPAWTFWRGVLLLGIDTEHLPEWASIGGSLDDLDMYAVTGVAPLLRIMGDSFHVWGVDASGKTVEVLDEEVTVIEGDIVDVLAQQIKDLVARQQAIASGTDWTGEN